MRYAIYALKDESGIRYIGQSINPRKRLGIHLAKARHHPESVGNPRLVEWLLSLSERPQIVILAQADTRERAEEIEEFLTIELGDHFDLLNEWAGRSQSEATKRKRSERAPMKRPDVAAKVGAKLRGERNAHAKLTEHAVREIRALRGTMFQREIAARFRVTQTAVGRIHSGKRWGHLS